MEHSTFLTIVDPLAPCKKILKNPAKTYSYPLDSFQEHALTAIEEGQNVLVTAKTGSGKTLVGEYLIHQTIRDGGRIFYTTPIKSLSNQKFNDLKKEFGVDMVGIMTGDIKFNPDARIIVMTTEILRNLLFKQGTSTESLGLTSSLSLKGLSAVVFDEVHYINDKDRGKVWEETMILLPPEIQLVLLSATIDRADCFASWLGDLKQRPITLISTQYRVVPLTHGVLIGQQFQTLMDSKDVYHDDTYRRWLEWRKQKVKEHEDFQRKVKEQRRAGFEGPVEGKTRPASFVHQMNETIVALERQKLLPALCFVFSRVGCEKYADKVEATLLDSSDQAKVKHIWDFHLHAYKDVLEFVPQAHKLRALAERGIAYHHSGLLPVLKEIIEILFSKGLIKLLFATETFAVGLNMPTKTVLFFGLEKYSEDVQGLRVLRTDEYIQMAGRAGRRGLDPVGTVIYLPERDPIEPGEMKAMMTGGRTPIQSKMMFDYEFILKTLQANSLTWIKLMEKSYWYIQRQEAIQAEEKSLKTLEQKRNGLPITDAEILELRIREGLEETLQKATNAKKRQATKELDKWKDEHTGPRWDSLWKLYPQAKKLEAEAQEAQRYKTELEAYTITIQPLVTFLQTTGFLKDTADKAEELTRDSLTEKGVLATEINEGHPLLMTELYVQGLCEGLTAEEIVCVLAGFLQEGGDDEKQPSVEKLQVSAAVKETLYKISDVACALAAKETQAGVLDRKFGYWDLNSYWIEPIWKWLDGADASALCAEYGFFEGNLQRTILKVVNLVEEWTVLATYKKDVKMLETLRGIDATLKHGIATTDSLYLRL
jgi:superfamily II RNA helicase